MVLEVEDHCRTGGGVAGGVGLPRSDAWLPLPDSVTPALQVPLVPTVAVPIAVALPLSNSVTMLPASPVPARSCAAWLVAPPALVIATTGAVVSRVKLSEAEPVLPKVSVWLATMVCGPSASPVGVNDQTPLASAVTVVAMAVPSMVKLHHGVGKPCPAHRIVRGDVVAGRTAGVDASASVTVGPVVLSV